VNLKKAFAKYENDYVQFSEIENPPHPCPDVCAFLRLNMLVQPVPGIDMISCAEHDQVWLATSTEALAAVATEADVLYLARCGVMYDEESESLSMFV
jgi:hypothetical protein